MFKMIEDYLPSQRGKIIDNLNEMRKDGDSIALLYHATGERVIIVMGAIYVIKPRVSGTFTKYNSCIA